MVQADPLLSGAMQDKSTSCGSAHFRGRAANAPSAGACVVQRLSLAGSVVLGISCICRVCCDGLQVTIVGLKDYLSVWAIVKEINSKVAEVVAERRIGDVRLVSIWYGELVSSAVGRFASVVGADGAAAAEDRFYLTFTGNRRLLLLMLVAKYVEGCSAGVC